MTMDDPPSRRSSTGSSQGNAISESDRPYTPVMSSTEANFREKNEDVMGEKKRKDFDSTEVEGTPERWTCDSEYRYMPKLKDGQDPWQLCHEAVKAHDIEMCEAWKDEINQLLIFAGLFSAAVTSFALESYSLLSPDPQDTTIALLSRIADGLDSGSSSSSTSSQDTTFNPSAAAIRINVFWFLSLTLSFTTVLLGTLCLQWLREYLRDARKTHRDTLAIRQVRFEGLMSWKIPNIVSGLPLLLQGAFVLFFIGLVDFLWTLDTIVASIVSVSVGFTFLVLFATTISPGVQAVFVYHNVTKEFTICPFKSAQSFSLYRLICAQHNFFVEVYLMCHRFRETMRNFMKRLRSRIRPNRVDNEIGSLAGMDMEAIIT
ncbi:hypothetical protein BDQ12DRAFT_655785, partial [Crucibulum laeve]